LFTNIFQGGYFNIPNLIERKPEACKTLFRNLIYLENTIKVEEYLSLIHKTLSVYDVNKILFCDYISHIQLENETHFDIVINLLDEGIDSLCLKAAIKSHYMVY
jgi:hypothetical protein